MKRTYSLILLPFHYFMMSVWTSLLIERYSAIDTFTKSRFCFFIINQVIISCISMTVRTMAWKQGWIYGRGWIWFQWSMECFPQTFHLMMWFFNFISWISFKWYYVLLHILSMLVWIGLWKIKDIYYSFIYIEVVLSKHRFYVEIINYHVDSSVP